MSATATKEPKAATTTDPDVAGLLGVETRPLAEVRSALGAAGDLALAKAWAAGDVEFGHRTYCVTGPVGKIGSCLVIEEGWDWSGPKTKMHKAYRDLLGETPPKTDKCKKYETVEPARFGEEPYLKATEIPPAEAHATIALHVRLTDKGLAGAD